MSLLFLSAISIALFSVSATVPPVCSPEFAAAGCPAACCPGPCSKVAVCPCAHAVLPKSNAPNPSTSAAPVIAPNVFRIPAPPPPRNSQPGGAGLVYPVRAPPDYTQSLTSLAQVRAASFVPQRLNRLQLCRLIRRQIPKKQSRRARHHKRQHHAQS